MAACEDGLTQEVTCDDKGDAFNAKDCSKYILNCVSDGFADFNKCLTEKKTSCQSLVSTAINNLKVSLYPFEEYIGLCINQLE